MEEKNHTISSSINRLNILAQRMEKNEGSISTIELDLFMQELRNLYGLALELTIQTVPAAKVESAPEPVATNTDTQPIVETAPEPIEKAPEPIEDTPEPIVPEVATVAAAETIATTVLAEETPENPPFAPAEAEETLSEYVTVNEMENIEGAKYDELFLDIEASETPQLEMDPLQEEAPIDNEPEPDIEKPDESAAVEESTPEPELELVTEPVKQTEPEPKPNQNNGQSSLLSYLKHTSIEGTPQSTAPRTLGESLHPYSYNIEEQLTNRVNSQKVADLRTIININDKFSFINELFHNNMKSYNDFILHLNSLQQREEALEYVATISQMNYWDENSLAVKTFFSLFDRKF